MDTIRYPTASPAATDVVIDARQTTRRLGSIVEVMVLVALVPVGIGILSLPVLAVVFIVNAIGSWL